jgi:hypothetical protein
LRRPPSVVAKRPVSIRSTLLIDRVRERYFEYMATTVHIPKLLLDAVDRRARALKVSRNRFIVRTLEQEIAERKDWSPGFFDRPC